MTDTAKTTPKGEALRKEGQRWLARIKDAEKLEDDWLKAADDAEKVFASGQGNDKEAAFNILYANVETIVPAIINSPPAPDIRRRFGDADPVAKEYSELLERAIRVQVDDSRLQIELEACAQDAYKAGRGIVRLRFRSDIIGEPELEEIAEEASDAARPADDVADGGYDGERADSGEAEAGRSGSAHSQPEIPVEASSERVENERCTFEAVSWRDYRHGPAKRWGDRKWDAFRHSMPQEEVDSFQDTEMVTGQLSAEDRTERGESDDDIVVWEIWCRKTRKVKFVNESTGVIIKQIEDPLGLAGFFPIATPVQPVEITGRLMPINPYAVYRGLAIELDNITKRINVLINAMQVKGWYAGSAKDLENVVNLEDNEFAPIEEAEVWAAHGGIDGAIAFWPVEKFITALKELYVAREQTKQAIYEITGISDIVRGATKASETLGAQQIKSQWGSLRIQKAQRAMERCARDLFVMMSEVIPAKFTPETLQKMTGVQLLPTEQDLVPVTPQIAPNMPPEAAQQAQAEAQKAEQARVEKLQKMQGVAQLMQERVTAYYRVDVETDSTIRADLTQQKQEVAEFLQGSGAYFSSVGPLVQQGVLPADVAIEIYASNARMFNLGKSTEDAIEQMIVRAKEQAKQPPPPDPEAIKAEAEMKAEQMRVQADMQAKQADMQIKTMEAKLDMQQAEMEFAAKSQELQGKMALEMAKSEAAGQKAQADAAIAVMSQQLKELELQMKSIDLQIKQKDLEIKQAQPVKPEKKEAA